MAMEMYRTWTGQSQRSHDKDSDRIQPVTTNGSTKDPFSGHLNHLSEKQEAAFLKFKSVLHEKGLWKPGGEHGLPSHDDATLLRYLRARKFDINGAVGQFSDTEHWMKENKIEDLYEHFDVDFYERARTLYPQWTGRRDRRGIPIYVYPIKPLDSKNVNQYTKESEKYKASLPNHKNLSEPGKMLPLFALYHNLLNFVLPMCSTLERPNPEVPITNSTNIVDISGVGLKQFWNLKAHMQEASVLATAHYPETLDRIFIIGAPSFFPTVWGWIKRWFDPVTVSKIFILGHQDVKSTLEKFMDPDNFPKRYGGNLEWEWGQYPNMGEGEKEAIYKDGHHEWIPGPALWVDGKRVAVGSVLGKNRRTNVPPGMAGRASMQLNGSPVLGGRSMAGSTRSRADTAKSVDSAAHAPAPNHAPPGEQHASYAEKDVLDSTVADHRMSNGFTKHSPLAPQPSAPQAPLPTPYPNAVAPKQPPQSSVSSAQAAVAARAAHLVPATTSVSITPSGDVYLSHPADSSEEVDRELSAKTQRLSMNRTARPPIEHFVTAKEIPTTRVT